MTGRRTFVSIVLFIALEANAAHSKKPRYIFILPSEYVGWVQIIFNDPAATTLPIKDGGYIIDIPESGVVRTSDIRVHDFKRQDEFYYHSSPTREAQELREVSSENVLPGDSHGGFGVMDTGGKGKGYSWFIFFGPPSIRSSVPLADGEQNVKAWRKLHGNARMTAPGLYPTPGRLPSAGSTQQ